MDLDHLKTTLGMDVLPAESPQMVIKEVWAHFLAYNLLRALMWEAGERYGVDPLRLSLKGVLPQVLAHREHVGVFAPRTVPFMILSRIQSNKIPDRPGRCEPRARKRRPKQYNLMNEPHGLHVIRWVNGRNGQNGRDGRDLLGSVSGNPKLATGQLSEHLAGKAEVMAKGFNQRGNSPMLKWRGRRLADSGESVADSC